MIGSIAAKFTCIYIGGACIFAIFPRASRSQMVRVGDFFITHQPSPRRRLAPKKEAPDFTVPAWERFSCRGTGSLWQEQWGFKQNRNSRFKAPWLGAV